LKIHVVALRAQVKRNARAHFALAAKYELRQNRPSQPPLKLSRLIVRCLAKTLPQKPRTLVKNIIFAEIFYFFLRSILKNKGFHLIFVSKLFLLPDFSKNYAPYKSRPKKYNIG
jgi:hypothetical protein